MDDTPQGGLFGPPPPAVGPAEVAPALAALAARLPDGLRMGTSSWTFPGWAGLVWDRPAPAEVLAREGLAAYAAHPLLGAVGVDRTYYRPVPSSLFRAWTGDVPAGFGFLVKAWRGVTLARLHDGGRGSPNPGFLDAALATDRVVGPFVEGLADRPAVLLFQFTREPLGAFGGPERFAASLHAFLDALPRGPTYAVEVRERALLTRDYADALRAAGAVHGIVVFPGMPSPITQARVAAASGPGPRVVRWMLRPDRTYREAKAAFAPFDRLQAPHPEARAAVAQVVAEALSEGDEAWVIANNKAEGSAPRSLAALARALVDAAG